MYKQNSISFCRGIPFYLQPSSRMILLHTNNFRPKFKSIQNFIHLSLVFSQNTMITS